MSFPGGSVVKNLPANAGDAKDVVQSLGWEDPLEKEMATHSSILALYSLDREDWWVAFQAIAESDKTKQLNTENTNNVMKPWTLEFICLLASLSCNA